MTHFSHRTVCWIDRNIYQTQEWIVPLSAGGLSVDLWVILLIAGVILYYDTQMWTYAWGLSESHSLPVLGIEVYDNEYSAN